MEGCRPNAQPPVLGTAAPPKPARLLPERSDDSRQNGLRKETEAATISRGDNKKLENRLLSALECPVCFEYMSAPIFTCTNGHNLCGSCLAKCHEVCPTCDVRIDSRRNLALEQLSAAPRYPCSHSSRGCPERLLAQAKVSHETGCAYRPLACPLVCGWRGPRGQLLSHVTRSHPDCYSAKHPDLPHFWQSVSQKDCFHDYRHAVFAFGETFAYVRRFSVERRKMHLAVMLLGDPAKASNFRYRFKMAKDDSDRYKSVSLVCSVHSYDEALETIFQKNDCISIDFETLVFYGNGPRSLKISKVRQVDVGRGSVTLV